jgi:hypothetical protein
MNVRIKTILHAIAFIFTIFMVLYGLNKGFDTVELLMNIIYFTVVLLTTFIDLIEQITT